MNPGLRALLIYCINVLIILIILIIHNFSQMKHQQMMACTLIAAALIGYIAYVQGRRMMESFKGNKGKWLFTASPHAYPVVCLAGNSKLPCTAFSSA
jgi:hypothetical protein